LLRRSGRRRSGGGRSGIKNQTQNNMSPFVRRGDITTIYEVGNPCHGLVQTHSCGRVYSVSRLSVEIIQYNAIFFYLILS